MEWTSRIQRGPLDYTPVTAQIAVGGSFRNGQIGALKANGVTAVVDCRAEARDDEAALASAGIVSLHLPAPDRHAPGYSALREGVEWLATHTAEGGVVFLHCEHGVGRAPLVGACLLVAQGHPAADALRLVRSRRWQALPNDRQLKALLDFEHEWQMPGAPAASDVGRTPAERGPANAPPQEERAAMTQRPLPALLVRGVVMAGLLGTAAAAALLIWADFGSVLWALAVFPPALVIPVLALTATAYALRWLKWHFYLRVLGVSDVRATDSLLVFLSGYPLGLTPGKAGELGKSYWIRELSSSDHASFARTAPIVFAERLTDGLAMLIFAAAGLIAFRVDPLVLGGTALMVLFVLIAVRAERLAHFGFGLLRRVRLLARLAIGVEQAYDSAREILSWRRLMTAVGLGSVALALECSAFFLILFGLGASSSVELFLQASFAFSIAGLVGSASLLPGGVGATEGASAGILGLIAGLSPGVSVAGTFLIRAATLWFAVAAGAGSMVLLTRRVLHNQGVRPARVAFTQPLLNSGQSQP
jgi:uncharacterized protein (TIRG00374 family)